MSFFQHHVPITHTNDGGASPVAPGSKRTLRKSPSVGGLLSPLVRLARNPKSAIEEFLSLPNGFDSGIAEEREKERITLEQEGHRQVLYLRLKDAQSYDDWRSTATELDNVEGRDAWKQEDECAEYDFALVQARLKQLDDARLSCDVRRMLFVIRTSLRRSLGNMGELRLYKRSHVGTKTLIERYIESAQETIDSILSLSGQQGEDCVVDSRYLLEQILQARQSFGRSALLLSGGGTFGMNHIGVVKCLWENKMLPRIVSGASAGSIVAAVLGARTDEEMPGVIADFCYGDLDVFEEEGKEDSLLVKAARFLKHGSIFEIKHLVRAMRGLLGDMTFQEAYNRTRRILNIPVSSAGLYELPRLLNYITAPNVMIWSAVAASCSVPFIYSAASLMTKDPRTGEERPWNPTTHQWIDGSVDNDLPMSRLSEMFNVNHFIVSQVNPHVVPFLKKEEEEDALSALSQPQAFNTAIPTGPTWLNTLSSLAQSEALHRMHMLTELGIAPTLFTKLRSILSQRYSGDINIFPEISYAQFPRVLVNPTTEFMVNAMEAGERATWPKMSRIMNHCAIELKLDAAVSALRARVAFSPSQIDLRQSLHGSLSGSGHLNHNRRVSQDSLRGRRGKLVSAQSYHHSPLPHHQRQHSATTTTAPFQLPSDTPTLRIPRPSPTSRLPRSHKSTPTPHTSSSSNPTLKLPSPDPLSSSTNDDDQPPHPSPFDPPSETNEYDSPTSPDLSPDPDARDPRGVWTSISQPTTPLRSRRSFGSGSGGGNSVAMRMSGSGKKRSLQVGRGVGAGGGEEREEMEEMEGAEGAEGTAERRDEALVHGAGGAEGG